MEKKETLGQRVIRYMELLGKDAQKFTTELSITKEQIEKQGTSLRLGPDDTLRVHCSEISLYGGIVDHAGKHDTFKAFIEDGILVDRMNEFWVVVSKRDER